MGIPSEEGEKGTRERSQQRRRRGAGWLRIHFAVVAAFVCGVHVVVALSVPIAFAAAVAAAVVADAAAAAAAVAVAAEEERVGTPAGGDGVVGSGV